MTECIERIISDSVYCGTESTVFVPEPTDRKFSGTKQGIVVPEWLHTYFPMQEIAYTYNLL